VTRGRCSPRSQPAVAPRPGGRRSPGPAWSGIPRPRSRRRDSGHGVPSVATTMSRTSNSSPQRTVGCQRTRQCQRRSRSQGSRLRSTAAARGRCCSRIGKHASATKGTRRSDVIQSGRRRRRRADTSFMGWGTLAVRRGRLVAEGGDVSVGGCVMFHPKRWRGAARMPLPGDMIDSELREAASKTAVRQRSMVTGPCGRAQHKSTCPWAGSSSGSGS
jgi:hypothetical protein